MRRMIQMLFFSLTVSMLSSMESYGHGGQYRGPGDQVPPNRGGGGDTRPPGGNSALPPGVPQTGGGARSGGRGSGMPNFGGRSPLSGRSARSNTSFDQWEFWWAHNKEPYLNLKSRLRARGAITGGGIAVGRGNFISSEAEKVTVEEFDLHIRPLLLQILQRETQVDIVDSTVLALARSLEATRVDQELDAILNALKHDQDSARQSATLSLGVLGHPSSRSTLLDLMNDNANGRSALGDSKPVPSIIRGFAALAIGMIMNSEDIPRLIEIIDSSPDAERDLKSSALLALGMYSNEFELILPYLHRVMERNDVDRVVRSLAPISLSRLQRGPAATASLPILLAKVRSNKTDNDMMRSCVIALGKLADMSNESVVDALYALTSEHSDHQTQHFAFIALGEIASRDRDPSEQTADCHKAFRRFLFQNIVRPDRATHKPWASLALGIYAREHREDILFVSESINKLSGEFEETSDPSHRSAIAIALGLLNATSSGKLLHRELCESKDQELRGYIAVALGLMDYKESADDMRQMITKKGVPFEFRLNLARGLGLMNDVESVKTLVASLESSKSLTEFSSVAQAIGLIGNSSAMEPLIRLAQNQDSKDLVRAFSIVALGLLAEKTELPWNAHISVGLNYRSKTEALSEILDIL